MAHFPRSIQVPKNSIFHVTWQCHNKDFLLKPDWAKKKYYELLLSFKAKYGIKIYSYCFMSNHPHLTGYSPTQKNMSDFFRVVNSLFARHCNKVMQRKGQLVMDRFKSPIIEDSLAHLDVMHYCDINPKRASMVSHPEKYKWSSYKHYAHGQIDPLLDEPECYTHLGQTPKDRQEKYRAMVEAILNADWKEKRDYSISPYIGNPEWVSLKYAALLEINRNRLKNKSQSPPPDLKS